MFARLLSTGRVAAVLTMAALMTAAVAHAQQNSVVFPWNAGYQSNTPQPPVSVAPVAATPTQPILPAQPSVPAVTPSRDRSSTGEEQEESADAGRAFVDLRVPANAEIWFEGDKTAQAGALRHFVSPNLESGRTFTYDIRARWTDPNGKVVDQTRKVKVEAGRRTMVDFNTPAPAATQNKPKEETVPKPNR